MNKPPSVWQRNTRYNVEGLINALTASDQHIRRRAAVALGKIQATEAIPALRHAASDENDTRAHAAMLTALEDLGAASAQQTPASTSSTNEETPLTRLVKQLEADDNESVIAAARQLGELGDKLAVGSLVMVFNDARRSIHVRLAIAEALLKLESAPVEVALLANLRHNDWHIRRNGAAILGQLRAEWAIQPLAQAIRDAHPVVRRTARAALKHIGTPEARKALAQENMNQTRQPIKPSTSPLSDTETLRRQQQAEEEAAKKPVAAPRTGLLQRVETDDVAEAASETISTVERPALAGTKPLSNIDPDAYRPRPRQVSDEKQPGARDANED